jgi:hypothetical protein
MIETNSEDLASACALKALTARNTPTALRRPLSKGPAQEVKTLGALDRYVRKLTLQQRQDYSSVVSNRFSIDAPTLEKLKSTAATANRNPPAGRSRNQSHTVWKSNEGGGRSDTLAVT